MPAADGVCTVAPHGYFFAALLVCVLAATAIAIYSRWCQSRGPSSQVPPEEPPLPLLVHRRFFGDLAISIIAQVGCPCLFGSKLGTPRINQGTGDEDSFAIVSRPQTQPTCSNDPQPLFLLAARRFREFPH